MLGRATSNPSRILGIAAKQLGRVEKQMPPKTQSRIWPKSHKGPPKAMSQCPRSSPKEPRSLQHWSTAAVCFTSADLPRRLRRHKETVASNVEHHTSTFDGKHKKSAHFPASHSTKSAFLFFQGTNLAAQIPGHVAVAKLVTSARDGKPSGSNLVKLLATGRYEGTNLRTARP